MADLTLPPKLVDAEGRLTEPGIITIIGLMRNKIRKELTHIRVIAGDEINLSYNLNILINNKETE